MRIVGTGFLFIMLHSSPLPAGWHSTALAPPATPEGRREGASPNRQAQTTAPSAEGDFNSLPTRKSGPKGGPSPSASASRIFRRRC